MLKTILTLGPIGYLPAPGTMATLATLPLVIFLHYFFPATIYAFACALIFIFGVVIIQKILHTFNDAKDPSEIVIDEVAGCLVTFICVPINFKTVILGFILFRLFDIFKFSIIKKCEELPGAWGIMVDDVAAGVLANMVMQILGPFLA